jgi:hypothetical protein
VRIVFPDCLAKVNPNDPNQVVEGGQVVDYRTDHKSHMAPSKAQPDGSRACSDPSYPILVPRLTLNANFPVPKPTGTVTLSSGAASTMHADFWNTWDQDALNNLVSNCINNGTLGKHPLVCRSPTGK